MATRPKICPPANIPGFIFFRDKFVLQEDFVNTTFFDFSKMIDVVTAYSRSQITLGPNKSVMFTQSDIGDAQGFVRWIAVKVRYPQPINPILFNSEVPIIPGVPTPINGTPQTQKYINWSYLGQTNYIGELMILTGNPGGSSDSLPSGWNLGWNNPEFPAGGITFNNPHADFSVKLELIVAF
jgi:hypothetical protein